MPRRSAAEFSTHSFQVSAILSPGSLGSSAGGLGGGRMSPRHRRRGVTSRANRVATASPTQTHLMGRRGPFSFTIVYDGEHSLTGSGLLPGSASVQHGPDRPTTSTGNGSKRIAVPAGIDNYVTVKVTGPDSGTRWEYTVYCPSLTRHGVPMRHSSVNKLSTGCAHSGRIEYVVEPPNNPR